MEIKDGDILIRPLIQEDVFEMEKWGVHKSPLLADYNYPNMSDTEKRRWYRIKTFNLFNKYFAILTNSRLIGYMGIKNIKRIRKESTLGIVFDPNFTDKGYGTRTLELFLNYYFHHMNMKVIYLEVAKFNDRAMRVYEKMGFKITSYYCEEFFNQRLDLKDPYYLEAKASFVIVDEKLYNYIYRMKLKMEDFTGNTRS